jgi:hypothetical protein
MQNHALIMKSVIPMSNGVTGSLSYSLLSEERGISILDASETFMKEEVHLFLNL